MSDEQRWTIGELADRADTTPRTIRYYTAEGLLPPPETRGKYALYGADHLHRLRLIARLKAAYLPLQEIRARLQGLTAEQIDALLAAPAEAPADSAAEYVARVLQPAPPPIYRPLGYGSGSAAATPRVELDELGAGPRASLRDAAPGRPNALAHCAPAWPDEDRAPDVWRRLMIAPGVELHLQDSLAPEVEQRVARLLALIQQVFPDDTKR